MPELINNLSIDRENNWIFAMNEYYEWYVACDKVKDNVKTLFGPYFCTWAFFSLL